MEPIMSKLVPLASLTAKSGPNSKPRYLKDYRIPPAWTDVMVATEDRGGLLITGVDSKGRVQSIYSKSHTERATRKKFAKINRLIGEAVRIRRQVERGIKDNTLNREEAIVTYLLIETGIRPGSRAETLGSVKAYGATTLQARHVKVMTTGRVWLNFVGKKGVRIRLRVTNPWLVEELTRRKKAITRDNLGWSTPIFRTTDSRLRSYVRTLGSGCYTPKDFRTLLGTSLAASLLKNKRVPSTQTKRNALIRKVVKAVASKLGNTPAVCRKSYINPSVFKRFQ